MKQVSTMRQILALRPDPRCSELVDFLRRCAEAQGEGDGVALASPGAAAAALERLASRGRLSYRADDEGTQVLYTPSRDALLGLSDSQGLGFPDAVRKKQAAALRRSAGAIFRFPWEEGEGHLEVFITDWSPCPAAAAVAIHRDHLCVAEGEKPEGFPRRGTMGGFPRRGTMGGFTGRFVRHPLTGDLLPVWVADWVRPDFGTGAVLVNPAHDATDLRFAREVGLPLRFGLVPPGFDGGPESWPAPPVVKTGNAIKTGICDGLPGPEAMARYFEILSERGLAERTQDVQAGRALLARMVPDLEPDALFETALALASEAPLSLVCPAAEQAEGLLFLRLLCFDLHARPLEPAELFLVQKAQGAPDGLDPEVLRLALLAGAPLNQVLVIKQKATDQVGSFLRVHAALREACAASSPPRGTAASPEPGGDVPKALRTAKAAMLAGDPARAFAALLQLQKQLKKTAASSDDALSGYFAAAHVLAGAAAPDGVDVRKTWNLV